MVIEQVVLYSSIMSACLGVGGVSDKMLLILDSGGVEKSWLGAEIKRK